MIDKKAYDMLVDNYANELLKEAKLNFGAAKRLGGAVKGGAGRIANSRAVGAVKGGAKRVGGAIKSDVQNVRSATKSYGIKDGLRFHYGQGVSNRAKRKLMKQEPYKGGAAIISPHTQHQMEQHIRKMDKIRGGVGLASVGGTGIVYTGNYAYNKHKTASEMVMDIMEKRASQQYGYDEEIAKSAAELLVEAVMYKQAAYDQMENAQACFDAGQVALDSIGYKL